MKEKLKKIFSSIFGTQENIMIKINISCFIASVIFFMFAFTYQTDYGKESYFTFISAFFFAMWIILTGGVDSLGTLASGTTRLFCFLCIFVGSFSYSLQYVVNDKEISLLRLGVSVVGIVLCITYVVCKMVDIFNFVKKLFGQIKLKLFNTDKPATNKAKALIENSTAFMIAIGGFAIAIKTIVETIYQIMEYFV